MGHSRKSKSHLEKQVTLEKMGHTLKKCVIHAKFTLGEMGQTWKVGSHLDKKTRNPCLILRHMVVGLSFVLASAVLWNDLPQAIKDSQSVETFKQKLKTHLFLQSYNGQ